ncbi:uncharacterized protein LOC106180507 isoform X2 [Lingula anatina]|uniref:Uncharacterized protein LOC106180507 isoform X2 n=1 Tax=Lingula anatina TaxID=7574 RepID=A0A1S3KCH9_LINAN|nr:uncharacterized protein LOC106180507 isoform X2 [Lingula anatina]|eukprot:XP_013419961.1 uncharacterized protein LOC106180507 isoform X2 [Lingula anatina]
MAGVTLCNMAGCTITILSMLMIVLPLLGSVQGCNVAGSSYHNGKCYFVNTNATMWQSAMEHCKNTCNGRLAVVKDNDTQIFLHKLTSSEVWLGGKEVNLTDWMWIDQEGTLHATTYTHWRGQSSGIAQQPDTYHGQKFQPAVALMRVDNTQVKFPWVDREYLQTQESGVICEADQKSELCKGHHSFQWIQNNSRWTDIKGGACVFISIQSEMVTWLEGHRLCKEAGGKLLKIDNDTVQKNLENRLNNNSGPRYYWIGLVHSQWRWVDEYPINLMFWRPTMYPPHHVGPTCLALEGAASDVTRSWVMKKCSEKLPFICEYPLDLTIWSTTTSAKGGPPVTSGTEVPHTGMIAGIAVGGCSVVIILVIVGVGFWWRRKRRTNTHITKASVQYTDEAAGSYYDHVATEDGLDSQTPKRETRPYYKGLVTRAAYDSKQAKHGGQAQTGSAETDNVTNENIVVGGTNGVGAGHIVSDRNSNMIESGTYSSIDRDDGADLNADFGRSFGTYSTMDDVNVAPQFTSINATEGMGREPPSSDNGSGNKVTDSALSEDDISQLYGKVDKTKKKKYRQQHEGNPDDTIDEIEMTENDIYGE